MEWKEFNENNSCHQLKIHIYTVFGVVAPFAANTNCNGYFAVFKKDKNN